MDKRFWLKVGSSGDSVRYVSCLLMGESWEACECEDLVQLVSRQYLRHGLCLMHGWSCSLKDTKNGTTIVKIGSAFQFFDGSTGEWENCSRSCVKPEMALVRCGSCGSSCVLDGLAKEEDASERARSDVGVDAFVSASQLPEDQSVCCNVSTDFEEEIVIKNTFLQVVRREPGRSRA